MFSSREFEKLCTPAKLYFALAILSILLGLFSGLNFMAILGKLVFAVIYTFILGWLCSKGYTNISWFLVLLPYIVIVLAMFGIAQITQHKGIMKAVKLQGAYGQEAMTMPGNMPMTSSMPMMPGQQSKNKTKM